MAETGKDTTVPGPDTVWKAESIGPLTVSTPVTLSYDNGKGLVFTRTIAIDDNYMFTVTDAVANSASRAGDALPLRPRLRLGVPITQSYYILHEGLIGVVRRQPRADHLQEGAR